MAKRRVIALVAAPLLFQNFHKIFTFDSQKSVAKNGLLPKKNGQSGKSFHKIFTFGQKKWVFAQKFFRFWPQKITYLRHFLPFCPKTHFFFYFNSKSSIFNIVIKWPKKMGFCPQGKNRPS